MTYRGKPKLSTSAGMLVGAIIRAWPNTHQRLLRTTAHVFGSPDPGLVDPGKDLVTEKTKGSLSLSSPASIHR